MARALYRDISFQVTANANGIPQVGIEFGRVHHACLAAGRDVTLGVSMATLAGDPCMEKRQPTVTIDGSGIAVLYRTHMTAQALCLHRQRGRRLRPGFEAGF